jgi:DNA polymerase-3 subunit delta
MPSPSASLGAGFAPVERFIAEVQARKLNPVYVLVGDEAFLQKQCREAILQYLVPPELRDFGLYSFDLTQTGLDEVLASARTPSLMAPFQVLFVSGVKNLYGRGSHEAAFAAIQDYVKRPNPDALIVFLADHLHIPADARRMELTDRERYERIRDTLGQSCTIVELARLEESAVMRWLISTASAQKVEVEPDAARELADALGGDMMQAANELEKLILYAGDSKRVTLTDVETMVLAAKQRSIFELTDAISAHDRRRALEVLQALLAAGAGEDAAIGHIFMLAKTFRQMLVVTEKNVRDSRALWQALWPGFRVPPFAAEDLVRQARRYKSRRQLESALCLIARADLDLRSNPPSKRLILEKLVLELGSKTGAGAPA